MSGNPVTLMADNPFIAPPVAAPVAAPAAIDPETVAKANPQIISGARWFWWIAGLSLVNTVMVHSGAEISFVIGLGFTLIADAMFQSLKPIAFAIDAVALGVFFLFGMLAAKGRMWAFVTGIVFYVLDAGIYLVFQDWMPLAFHGLALFYLVKATVALRDDLRAAKTAPAADVPTS